MVSDSTEYWNLSNLSNSNISSSGYLWIWRQEWDKWKRWGLVRWWQWTLWRGQWWEERCQCRQCWHWVGCCQWCHCPSPFLTSGSPGFHQTWPSACPGYWGRGCLVCGRAWHLSWSPELGCDTLLHWTLAMRYLSRWSVSTWWPGTLWWLWWPGWSMMTRSAGPGTRLRVTMSQSGYSAPVSSWSTLECQLSTKLDSVRLENRRWLRVGDSFIALYDCLQSTQKGSVIEADIWMIWGNLIFMISSHFLTLFLPGMPPSHNLWQYINRDGKYDSAVVFCRNVVQGLKIPQLWNYII